MMRNGSLVLTDDVYAPSSLVDLLRERSQGDAAKRGFRFLTHGAERSETELTYQELDRRARQIAVRLRDKVAPGDRVVLLIPPGSAYIEALFGVLYAGAIAVPAYPPMRPLERSVPRLLSILRDASPTAILTVAMIRDAAPALLTDASDVLELPWVAVDDIQPGSEEGWEAPALSPDSIAFLQYTSGSTAAPRGVLVSHGNLLHNAALTRERFHLEPESRLCLWLPPYHDMGLVGGIVQPLYTGFSTTLMSPLDFLQRPLRWLEAISHFRADVTGAPNFAYDLCVRKTTPAERAGLDLSSLRLVFNGAEPVRTETMDRFADAFAVSGFRREAFLACYGLAEATLMVSCVQPTRSMSISRHALAMGRVVEPSEESDATVATSSGHPVPEMTVIIVEPRTGRRLRDGEVGEIWLRGPSITQGYWRRPEATRETFKARTSPQSREQFLRTGDLGFMHRGELFITSRCKDLIVIRGLNHYPQDIERTAEEAHPAIRPGCSAAFSVDCGGEERLVLVIELDRRAVEGRRARSEPQAQERRAGEDRRQISIEPPDASAVTSPTLSEVPEVVRQHVVHHHGVALDAIVLLKPGTIPKTSSGKVQRHACRVQLQAGTLERIDRA
jgi:acyl-CoA synthetase (AMP-forming)/AMP-acid ligase II